jgi:hypothetical protein
MPDRSAIDKAARLFCCLAAAAACLGGRADASDAAADFARHVAPFVQRHCVQCHGDTKQEGDVRLDGRPPDFQDAATRKTWERVWGVIASGQMPPQEVPAPGSDEMIPVLDWIREQAASAESLARRDGGGGNGVRRLTSREQVRVWKDLLDLHYANHQPDLLRFLAQDPRSEHFINRGNVLLMQNEHVQRSLDLAERLLETVLPEPDDSAAITWTIKPAMIADHPTQVRKFYQDAEKIMHLGPTLTFPADGRKPDDPQAAVEVRAGCWPNEDRSGLVLNPIYRTRVRAWDGIILRYPQPVTKGTVRLVIRARAELPPGETALPTLSLDSFFRPNNQLKLEGPVGKLPYHTIWSLAELTVPRETTDLTVEIPLELTAIDFAALNSGKDSGLWLLLRNMAVPSRVPMLTPGEEQKRLQAEGKWKPASARPPKGTPGWSYYLNDIEDGPRVVVEQISLTVHHREPDDQNRARRVVGTAGPAEIRAFAERAWGRPVGEDEIQPYLTLRATQAKAIGELPALRQTLAAILVDPECLYLSDRRNDKRLQLIDLSRRLAITLWGSVPDERLKSLAASGRLAEPVALQSEIARMMADERFMWFTDEFCRQWLGLDAIAGMEGQWARPPQVDASSNLRNMALQQALMEEPSRFLHDALTRNRPVSHLVAPDSLVLNAPLAEFYGVEASIADGWQRVAQIPADRRHGIFSMSGPIAAASREEKEAQIYRGTYMLARLFGVEVGTPPASVPTLQTLNADKAFSKKSVREKLQIHVERTCAVCHQKIDPLGFAWEQFDQYGKVQKSADGTPKKVDSSGKLPDGRPFADLDAMCRLLLERSESHSSFPRAFVRAVASYAWGRELTLLDEQRIDRLLGDGDPLLADLLTAVFVDDLQHQGQ